MRNFIVYCSSPSWAGCLLYDLRRDIIYPSPLRSPLWPHTGDISQPALLARISPPRISSISSSLCTSISLRYTDLGLSTNYLISLILLGILVSYLPQHLRIISRRSSKGISPYFVLLGTTSGTCAFANIVNLPASQRDLTCCKELNGFECVAGILGIAQIGVQWSCFMVM